MSVNWKNQLLKTEKLVKSQPDEFGIFKGLIEVNTGIKFHEKKPLGANLRELSQKVSHQANWETPFYQEIIEAYLANLNPTTSVVADIGCGDGRFTQFLLKKGFQKVIALDAHSVPLKSLATYLKENNLEEKVLLLHSSLENIPLEKNKLDAFLAINVFYYMGDKTFLSMKNAISLLKSKATAIITEHDFEAVLLRALMFNEFDDFLKVLIDKRFKETNHSDLYYFPVKLQAEIDENWEKLGLKLIDKKGISLFHQFISIQLRKKNILPELLEKNVKHLRNLFKYLHTHGFFNKTNVYRLQKS